MQVPGWWVVASGIYFVISILWTTGLCVGLFLIYKKTMPLINEAQVQVRRVTNQAKSVAAKASNTADIVHAQTQNLLGNAQTTSGLVTRQARTVGATLTLALVAARVIGFVRRSL